MTEPYCFWSIATGLYADRMKQCVASARNAGVFRKFVVFSEAPIEDCECYDAAGFANAGPCFRLVYLKAGISRLPFEYVVWIDADSGFTRHPRGLIAALGKSPIHVPLAQRCRDLPDTARIGPMPVRAYETLMHEAGVYNEVYSSRCGFFILRRSAIETVWLLTQELTDKCKARGIAIDDGLALGYAMQMLCADPASHTLAARPDLWGEAGDGEWGGGDATDSGASTRGAHPGDPGARPAMVHLSGRLGGDPSRQILPETRDFVANS